MFPGGESKPQSVGGVYRARLMGKKGGGNDIPFLGEGSDRRLGKEKEKIKTRRAPAKNGEKL